MIRKRLKLYRYQLLYDYNIIIISSIVIWENSFIYVWGARGRGGGGGEEEE
jgi:hypothetical protein